MANSTITLQEPPFPDTQTLVKGSADATKLLKVEVDGLTTATTRTITMPDKDLTLDDIGDTRAPSIHKTDHEDGGGDEISVAALSGELADAQKVAVEDDGVLIGTRSTMNFTGAGVTVTDDAGNDEVDIDIPDSGGVQTEIEDANQNTGVQSERTADIDIVHIRSEGVDVVEFQAPSGASPQALFAPGSDAKPTVSFTGDTGTGWNGSGSGKMVGGTNGVQRIRVDNAGIGIGRFVNQTHSSSLTQQDVKFTNNGDQQREVLILSNQTTDGSTVELFIDGSSTRAVIPADTSWTWFATITGRHTNAVAGDTLHATQQGTIKRNNANSTVLESTPTRIEIDKPAIFVDVLATADDTNEALAFTVTGEAGKNINWTCTIEIRQVTG